jgi:hypothetical protein
MALDLNALLTAADGIGAVSYKTSKTRQNSQQDKPRVLSQTQYPCGLARCFEGTRQARHAFCMGGRVYMQMTWKKSPIPRAPFSQLETPPPEKGGNTLSCLSCQEESEYPCGFAADFGKTSPVSCACLVCLVDQADDLEAREERAAIMEHDGGMTRAEAEAAAGLGSCAVSGSFLASCHAGNPHLDSRLGCNAAAYATMRLTQ